MQKFLKFFNPRATPQSEPIPGSTQVANSAGGFAWELTIWAKLDRFLVLGTEGGTFYVKESTLTVENATAIAEADQAEPLPLRHPSCQGEVVCRGERTHEVVEQGLRLRGARGEAALSVVAAQGPQAETRARTGEHRRVEERELVAAEARRQGAGHLRFGGPCRGEQHRRGVDACLGPEHDERSREPASHRRIVADPYCLQYRRSRWSVSVEPSALRQVMNARSRPWSRLPSWVQSSCVIVKRAPARSSPRRHEPPSICTSTISAGAGPSIRNASTRAKSLPTGRSTA